MKSPVSNERTFSQDNDFLGQYRLGNFLGHFDLTALSWYLSTTGRLKEGGEVRLREIRPFSPSDSFKILADLPSRGLVSRLSSRGSHALLMRDHTLRAVYLWKPCCCHPSIMCMSLSWARHYGSGCPVARRPAPCIICTCRHHESRHLGFRQDRERALITRYLSIFARRSFSPPRDSRGSWSILLPSYQSISLC